jgi:hypothetical protein
MVRHVADLYSVEQGFRVSKQWPLPYLTNYNAPSVSTKNIKFDALLAACWGTTAELCLARIYGQLTSPIWPSNRAAGGQHVLTCSRVVFAWNWQVHRISEVLSQLLIHDDIVHCRKCIVCALAVFSKWSNPRVNVISCHYWLLTDFYLKINKIFHHNDKHSPGDGSRKSPGTLCRFDISKIHVQNGRKFSITDLTAIILAKF